MLNAVLAGSYLVPSRFPVFFSPSGGAFACLQEHEGPLLDGLDLPKIILTWTSMFLLGH